MRANFEDPAESAYLLPFPVGKSYMVTQSYCNPTGTHNNQLAYDFKMPVGVEILAARAGTVVDVRDDQPDIGTMEYYGRENYVFILHEDGTVGFYAHLQQDSVIVMVGDHVDAGHKIALSGNSGSTGQKPHLHFGVYAFWPNTEGYGISVNFRNAQGELDARNGLQVRKYYTALPDEIP